MAERLRCELVSQETVYDLVYKLAEEIRASDYHPDLVVAISRGGFTPARVLCDVLGLFNLTSIRVVHYSKAAVHEQQAFVKYPLCMDVAGQRILLVDDVNDTGDTLKIARSHLESLGPTEVRIAVLHEKSCSPVRAEYVAESLDKWHWLIYPWAVVEDVGGFLLEMTPPSADSDQAADWLLNTYGLRLPEDQLSHLLSLIRKRVE
ncbi:phosphoribosyltransferase [Solemya velum gill symbiont]|nr:phosphoribosyltransferase [Solemya velum gill symbiont]